MSWKGFALLVLVVRRLWAKLTHKPPPGWVERNNIGHRRNRFWRFLLGEREPD